MEREEHQIAIEMLSAFGSVGAKRFDVTWTDKDGEKQRFRRGVPIDTLYAGMPVALPQATARLHNLIVRPLPPPVFLQLDDLDAAKVKRVRPVSFLVLNTSPGNHQAWLALMSLPNDDFARRVRKGVGADITASGATRVAGSLNFKNKYAPDYPLVGIRHVAPGRTVAPAELEALGLVASSEPTRAPHASYRNEPLDRERVWPDYQRCLDGAPSNTLGNGPDVSRADFTFAMIAADWGFGIEAVVERLIEESTKARENGRRYAQLTATRGAAAAARNSSRPTSGLPQRFHRS